MDTKLRLLLRQFALTHDPSLAVAFATETLRSGATHPSVWLVLVVENPGDGDVYPQWDLFYAEEEANKFAVEWIKEWCRENNIQRWHDLYQEVKLLVADKRLDEAIMHFDENWIPGYNITVENVQFYEDV